MAAAQRYTKPVEFHSSTIAHEGKGHVRSIWLLSRFVPERLSLPMNVFSVEMNYREDADRATANSIEDTVGKVPSDRVAKYRDEGLDTAPDWHRSSPRPRQPPQRTVDQDPPAAVRTILRHVECRLWRDP